MKPKSKCDLLLLLLVVLLCGIAGLMLIAPNNPSFGRVAQGDVEEFRVLVISQPEVLNQHDVWRNTLTHLAVKHRRSDILAVLLAGGSDPNAKNLDNATPLHIAARLGDLECIELLIESGANVSLGGYRHWDSPIEIATANGRKDAVELLQKYLNTRQTKS